MARSSNLENFPLMRGLPWHRSTGRCGPSILVADWSTSKWARVVPEGEHRMVEVDADTATVGAPGTPTASVERWGIFEWSMAVANDGDEDATLSASFQHGVRSVTVAGFHDGAGTYRVRFMPDAVGEWRYRAQQPIARSWTDAPAPSRARSPRPRTTVRWGSAARSTSPTPTALRISPSGPPATPGTTSRPSCAVRRSIRSGMAPSTNCACASFPSATSTTRTSPNSTPSRVATTAASTSIASSPPSSRRWRHASASSRPWASRLTSSSSTPTTPGATRR